MCQIHIIKSCVTLLLPASLHDYYIVNLDHQKFEILQTSLTTIHLAKVFVRGGGRHENHLTIVDTFTAEVTSQMCALYRQTIASHTFSTAQIIRFYMYVAYCSVALVFFHCIVCTDYMRFVFSCFILLVCLCIYCQLI